MTLPRIGMMTDVLGALIIVFFQPKKMQAQLIPGDLESFAVRLWLGKEIFNKTVTEEIENFMG